MIREHPGAAAVTIAGAGNWLVGVDRIGPRVVEAAHGRYGPGVEVRALGSGALALLDLLHGQDLLLVVDACMGQGAPGTVHCYEPELTVVPTTVGSVHQIGPLETLLVARHFYPETLPLRTLFIAVETEGLDAEAEPDACQRVIAILDHEIAAWSWSRRSTTEGEGDERDTRAEIGIQS